MADGTEHLHIITKSCIQNETWLDPFFLLLRCFFCFFCGIFFVEDACCLVGLGEVKNLGRFSGIPNQFESMDGHEPGGLPTMEMATHHQWKYFGDGLGHSRIRGFLKALGCPEANQ